MISRQFILQLLAYGIANGALYGLGAIGLSLVYGIMGYLNIAHGVFVMLGAYASFYFFRVWGVDPFLSLPLTAFSLFIFGSILYLLLFARLVRLPEVDKVKMSLLLTFGLLVILPNAATFLWTADTRSVTTAYAGKTLQLGSIYIPYVDLATVILAVLVISAFRFLLTKTYFGKSIRAVRSQADAAALSGVGVNRIYMISFGIGTALAAAAGAVVSMKGFNPLIGFSWTNKALVVVILAGMGSINGIFAGGFLLGVVESLGVLFVGSMYKDVVGLVLFVLILILRPQGLFGVKRAA